MGIWWDILVEIQCGMEVEAVVVVGLDLYITLAKLVPFNHRTLIKAFFD